MSSLLCIRPWGDIMAGKKYILIKKADSEEILISENCREIIVKGEAKKIRYKESLVLKMLLDNYPNGVSRKTLSTSIWGSTYVFDETINQTIKNLRISLEDNKKEIITTIPRYGYCFGIKPSANDEIKKISHARLKMDIRNLKAV